jgi:hypothetical protein
MTVRDSEGRWWAAGIGLGVLLIGLGVFQLHAGLEDADRWASVFGVFLNVAGLAVAARSAVWARRAATSPPPAGGEVTNRIGGGRFAGPVVQGRDIHTGPASASRERPSTSGPPDAGAVSNRIEDGTFGGPVIQGRDVHGQVPPSTF